jgi:hypothetical protein
MAKSNGRTACDYCGEDMGPAPTAGGFFRGPDTCGAPECEAWGREEERGAQDEAAARAADDGFERYR